MKGFFFGLTAGLAAGITAQMMIAKNHEQMLEIVKGLRPIRLNLNSSIEDLYLQKQQLEEAISKKEQEEFQNNENNYQNNTVI